ASSRWPVAWDKCHLPAIDSDVSLARIASPFVPEPHCRDVSFHTFSRKVWSVDIAKFQTPVANPPVVFKADVLPTQKRTHDKRQPGRQRGNHDGNERNDKRAIPNHSSPPLHV